ncbi:MAG: dihydrofolate reductase [Kiritimatiellae bacterium]|jgi:dihydrofolate reductase|nr:dihydrofolate reductase [Kiritimatiellia bacterium]
MKAIVAVDLNWGIGCEGKLLQFIPEDMKFFKEKTIGNVVVMGRETFDSLPGKNPLKERVNIVLTRNESFKDDRLVICHSVEETLKELEKYDNDKIFIIGGETIYKQFLPYCDELYVTKVQNKKKADKFFPNIDIMNEWKQVEESEEKEYNNIKYVFSRYINND